MKEEIWTQTHRENAIRRHNEGRDQGDAAEAKECKTLPADHQRLGENHGTVFLKALKETNPGDTLIWDF